jgi:hypothetical protein
VLLVSPFEAYVNRLPAVVLKPKRPIASIAITTSGIVLTGASGVPGTGVLITSGVAVSGGLLTSYTPTPLSDKSKHTSNDPAINACRAQYAQLGAAPN